MNTGNAIGFFLLGAGLHVLALFTPAAGENVSLGTQALWLELMGFVTGGIGGGYLLRMSVSEIVILYGRFALRRDEAREQAAQGSSQALSMAVRATF